jgi:phage terminase large subunit
MGKGAAMQRIEAARRLFLRMSFDKEQTEAGREALAHYHEKIDEQRGLGMGPLHDWSSHTADAFGLMAVDYSPPQRASLSLEVEDFGYV